MRAISAAVAGFRVLADGTVRVTVDIEPKDRIEAMTLFGAPGQPLALAALQVGHAAVKDEPIKVGPLCREAVELCKLPAFQEWIALLTNDNTSEGGYMSEDRAKKSLCLYLQIDSRKELDRDDFVRDEFTQRIRMPFMKHMKEARQ